MSDQTETACRVTEIPAAEPAAALKYFEQLLRFETDCWDVHQAMQQGLPGFVLLDVRGPQSFRTGHVPGAVNLPHGKINRTNPQTRIDNLFSSFIAVAS